jgi:hypothetical protein
VTEFKKGDRVRIKKLSEKEFKRIYLNNLCGWDYNYYLNRYSKYFNNIYIVEGRGIGGIDLILDIEDSFYPEELIKIHPLKDRLNLIKELIK